MDDIKAMSAQLAEFSSKELEDLKLLAMDAYQVKKGRRDEVKKVLDAFSFFISKKVLAKKMTIVRGKPENEELLDLPYFNILAEKE